MVGRSPDGYAPSVRSAWSLPILRDLDPVQPQITRAPHPPHPNLRRALNALDAPGASYSVSPWPRC